MNALEAKTLDVIQHYSTYKEKLSQYKSLDYAERLCDVYKQIVSLEE